MAAVVDVLLIAYQLLLSPLYPATCRFHPSCSSYAREALRVHGLWGGAWRSLARLLRCHPFHPGGLDPVPPRRDRPEARHLTYRVNFPWK